MGRSWGASRARSLRCIRRATRRSARAAAPGSSSGRPDPGLDLRLVPRLSRLRRQDADRIMRRHSPVGPVDLRIVEGGPVDPALQIIGNQKLRRAAEETKTCARGRRSNPATSASTSALHRGDSRPPSTPTKISARGFRRLTDRRCRSACPNSSRTPFPRRHDGGASQPPFESTKQIAEAAVAVTLGIGVSVFLPEDRHRDAGTLQLARQGRPARRDPPPLALRDPGATKELALERIVAVTSSASGHANPVATARSDCPGSSSALRQDVARSRARSPHHGEAATSVAIVACSVPASPAARCLRRPSTGHERRS